MAVASAHSPGIAMFSSGRLPSSLAIAAAAFVIAVPPLAGQQGTPRSGDVRTAIDAYRRAAEMDVMEELRTLLALPNVASERADIERNAALLVTMLERRGVAARVLEAGGSPPAVYGELRTPGATRTIVLYAHFDGQPVDPEEWASPPWEPTLRSGRLEDGAPVVGWSDAAAPLPDDWRVYARSASDDKSPIVAYLAALDALRAAGISPSVNLKFFLEGEEEAGSTNLHGMLATHRSLLDADAWIFGDGPVHPTGRMQIVYGVRGITGLQLTVYGPRRALHSGHYGNWAPNPAAMLTRLVASMRDDDGVATIDGFHDEVRAPSDAELQAVARLPRVEESLRHELALGRDEGGTDGLVMRLFRPALNVTGLHAGGVGAQRRNAIPTAATAAMDIRLVPDMMPATTRAAVEAHIRAQGYHVVHEAPSDEMLRAHPKVALLQWEDGYAAVRTPLDLPASRAVARTVDGVLDAPALQVPMLGGSLPLAIFEHALGAPLLTVPMVNSDNNQHAANENLRIGNFWNGVLIYAALIARLGAEWEAEG
jgi:acetylornithine deacetylase/succinyl-diaminopimelate desuccinylase-like protein